jgi:hypothetical protein
MVLLLNLPGERFAATAPLFVRYESLLDLRA